MAIFNSGAETEQVRKAESYQTVPALTYFRVSLFQTASASTHVDTSKPALCALDPKEGECGQFHPRWYYNKNMNDCFQFMYRGCKGNDNNFRNKERCMRTCAHPGELTGQTLLSMTDLWSEG